MRIPNLIAIILILAVFVTSTILYFNLPDEIATHWNAEGEADNYSSKFFGLYLMPLIMVGIFLIFLLIPIIDPLKENVKKFIGFLNGLMLILLIFFTYVYGLMILWNLDYRIDFVLGLIPLMSVLFYYIGIVLPRTKRNWFVGIRTPWTLSNDIVWEKTHRIGGILFKISAVINLAGLFLEDLWIWFAITPLVLSAIFLLIYSYFEFNKLESKAIISSKAK